MHTGYKPMFFNVMPRILYECQDWKWEFPEHFSPFFLIFICTCRSGTQWRRENLWCSPEILHLLPWLHPTKPQTFKENPNDKQLPREMLPSLQGCTQCLPRDKRQAAGMYSFLPWRWYHKGWAGLQPVCRSCVLNFKQTLRRRRGRPDSPGRLGGHGLSEHVSFLSGFPHTALLSSAPSEGSHTARYFSNTFDFGLFFWLFPLPCKATVANCKAACTARRRHGFALGV